SWKPDPALFEVAHHSRGRVQSKRAAARQNNAVDLLDRVKRVQKICLASARRRASNINARYRAVLAKDRRASRRPARVREVSHLDARNIGNEPSLPAVCHLVSSRALAL